MNCLYTTELPDWLRQKYERLGCDCLTCQARSMRVCVKSQMIPEFEIDDFPAPRQLIGVQSE